MKHNELYCSVDIEADGRIPGMSSMLSLGAAMYTPNKTCLATFSANSRTVARSVSRTPWT